MKAEKRNTTGINLKLPSDLSIALSRRVIDLRESGMKLTKEQLILKYASAGLKADEPGPYEAINKS